VKADGIGECKFLVGESAEQRERGSHFLGSNGNNFQRHAFHHR
jgi:hypothetical protein